MVPPHTTTIIQDLHQTGIEKVPVASQVRTRNHLAAFVVPADGVVRQGSFDTPLLDNDSRWLIGPNAQGNDITHPLRPE